MVNSSALSARRRQRSACALKKFESTEIPRLNNALNFRTAHWLDLRRSAAVNTFSTITFCGFYMCGTRLARARQGGLSRYPLRRQPDPSRAGARPIGTHAATRSESTSPKGSRCPRTGSKDRLVVQRGRPVVPAPRDQAHAVAVAFDAEAVTVILHFVKPVRVGRDGGRFLLGGKIRTSKGFERMCAPSCARNFLQFAEAKKFLVSL